MEKKQLLNTIILICFFFIPAKENFAILPSPTIDTDIQFSIYHWGRGGGTPWMGRQYITGKKKDKKIILKDILERSRFCTVEGRGRSTQREQGAHANDMQKNTRPGSKPRPFYQQGNSATNCVPVQVVPR